MWKIKHNLVPNDVNLEFSTSNRKSANEAVVKPMPIILLLVFIGHKLCANK